VKDVMLEIKYAPSPHTANLVAELLYDCISSWDLNGRVTAIITDNGSNMKAAFPILTQKDQCETIQRLPLQRKLGYEDIMRCIQDVQTCWNSSYYAWDRLFYLKDAIIQLQTDLYTSTNREDKKDGTKLKKIMLSEEEWELLDKLIDLLSPFEGATRYFSGGTYVTLSKMMLTIKEFTFDLATDSENLPSNDADYLNEDTIFEEGDVEIDNEEIISNITKKKISIKNPLKTEGILEK
ncbi:20690_t:CDS:2, partial [Rhizophagus irregularis]